MWFPNYKCHRRFLENSVKKKKIKKQKKNYSKKVGRSVVPIKHLKKKNIFSDLQFFHC